MAQRLILTGRDLTIAQVEAVSRGTLQVGISAAAMEDRPLSTELESLATAVRNERAQFDIEC